MKKKYILLLTILVNYILSFNIFIIYFMRFQTIINIYFIEISS